MGAKALMTLDLELRKNAQQLLEEIARCQQELNIHFTLNTEKGQLLRIMYEILDKADPEGKFFAQYEAKVLAMRKNLETDQDYWTRSKLSDSIGRPWLQQVQTPGAESSRSQSGCTKEKQTSGNDELSGATPATAIDPEETSSPPADTDTSGL